jgi:hypothetical protein
MASERRTVDLVRMPVEKRLAAGAATGSQRRPFGRNPVGL